MSGFEASEPLIALIVVLYMKGNESGILRDLKEHNKNNIIEALFPYLYPIFGGIAQHCEMPLCTRSIWIWQPLRRFHVSNGNPMFTKVERITQSLNQWTISYHIRTSRLVAKSPQAMRCLCFSVQSPDRPLCLENCILSPIPISFLFFTQSFFFLIIFILLLWGTVG